nr:MAG TPA: Poxvirus A21 Protein [Caudoviricetes sp.]
MVSRFPNLCYLIFIFNLLSVLLTERFFCYS